MQGQYGLVAMIQQGYYATYPLIAISVICITVILERLWALAGLRRRINRTALATATPLREGNFEEALRRLASRRSPAERLYHALVAAARTDDREALARVDEEQRFEELLGLRRYVWVLATSGASAPFIGLFGTVVGILSAFQSMAIMGTGGFSVVAAGISEALISTALGLAVAIIAVIFYNYFSVRIENLNALMHVGANRLINAALEGRQASGN
ncbi:MAG TPA: MotA/TolQ/ExbB proton channel family protein [Candidatus Binataceae bacterium]|nr:MotA/TolQ/ExbB proton channel family protein [Candidatus Binataceae bacterium]